MPGSVRSATAVGGSFPPCRATTSTASRWRRTARALKPMPDQARITSATGAWARASIVGKDARNSAYLGIVRATWVCWSMTSDTKMAYGSVVRRQGRSRAWEAYQSASAACRAAGCGVSAGAA